MYELSIISLIALCLVSFIGVPHGSFDGAVAALLGYQSKKRFLTFTFWYTIISIAVIFFWINFPLIALLLFIIMSIIHFGLCDWSFLKVNQFKWIITLTHGFNIIFGIIFFHTKESFQIFTFLSNDNFMFFEQYLFFVYFLFGILFLVYCYLSINLKKLRWGILEMISILFVVSQLDPLTGFALYFCFVHTTKHVYAILKNTNKYLENRKFVFTTTAIFTLITWIGGCIAIIYLNDNFSFSESFIKTIFIGLAALTLRVDAAKQFATVADMQLSEIGSSQTPVGTTMALMERGTKVMSAVHKRLHYAQKKEFELLAKIFKLVLPPMYPYNVTGGPREIKIQDFDDNIDILPISDPNIFSMSQRVTLAQNQLQLAQSNPQMHNLYEAYRRMYIALGDKDVEQILPIPQGPQPQDPAMEHSVVLRGAPLQAFPDQNHELHIKAHRTFMSSALVKANPMAIMNLVSHINQHVSLLATQTVDQAMVEEAEKLRQQFGEQIPPEALQALQMQRSAAIDNEIVKITEQMVGEEQEALQDQNMDPLVLLKQQELALRQAEMEMNAQLKGENQALKENQFDYKQVLDSRKLQKDYDLANLRADVALERANAPKQEG